MRVVLFGGSFNPPHVAHVFAAAYTLATEIVDRILVVPVYSHAFDKDLAPFDHRIKMCKLAMSCLHHVEISEVERELGSPSRTLKTIECLLARHPDWSLRLLVGADVLHDTHKWLSFDEIARRAPPIVLGRVGAAHASAPAPLLPDISSTYVRGLLKRIDDAPALDELRRLLPHAVLEYIRAHGLYR